MFLSDPRNGSLIFITPPSYPAIQPTAAAPATQTAPYATNRGVMDWRPDQASWRPIAQSIAHMPAVAYTALFYAIESYSHNGGRTLWAVTGSPNANGDGRNHSVRMARLT